LLGGVLTEYAADAAGDVIDEANVKGTSVLQASTGIATTTVVASTGAAELKEGWFIALCTGAAVVDVYALSSASFSRGTDESLEDNSMKVTASELTITTGSATAVPNFGIQFTGGSGTIGMTTGDSMRFYVQAPTSGSNHVKFGQASTDFSDVGVIISGQMQDESFIQLHLFKCKVAGMAIPFAEKAFGTYDITIEPSYDVDENAYGEIRQIAGE